MDEIDASFRSAVEVCLHRLLLFTRVFRDFCHCFSIMEITGISFVTFTALKLSIKKKKKKHANNNVPLHLDKQF